MPATSARIGFIQHEFRRVVSETADAKTRHGSLARQSDDPIETFFDNTADAQIVCDARQDLLSKERRLFRATTKDIAEVMALDYSGAIPLAQYVDTERAVDARMLLSEVVVDFARQTATLTIWGGGPQETPAWVPDGALVVADFENERYWRLGLGACTLDDILEHSDAWFRPWDPDTMVVPGVGMTTGVSGVTAPEALVDIWATAKLTDPAFALAYAGGWCATMEAELSGTLAEDGEMFATIISQAPSFSPFVNSNVGIFSDDPYYDPVHGPGIEINMIPALREHRTEEPTVPTVLATCFDVATGKMITSFDGATGPTDTAVLDYSGINQLVLSVEVYKPATPSSARIKRVVFYPPKSQTELNALTMASWLRAGALLSADFKNGRYWRRDIGNCGLADVMDDDADWWFGVDGPTQRQYVVPGTGLTSGTVTATFDKTGLWVLPPAAFAAVFDGGFCLVGEVVGSSTSALAGGNAWGVYTAFATYPSWTPIADAQVEKYAGGTLAQFGSNYDTYGPLNPFPLVDRIKFALNYDAATNIWTGSVNGVALSPFTRVTDMSGATKLVINALASGGGNSVISTIEDITFLAVNWLDQTAMDALTAL